MVASTAQRSAPSAPSVQLRTVLANLVAVRLEDDDAIRLQIADSYGNCDAYVVAFLAPATSPLWVAVRAELARQQFIGQMCRPSFEGWTRLCGTARLRLLDDGERLGQQCPVVLHFAAQTDADDA